MLAVVGPSYFGSFGVLVNMTRLRLPHNSVITVYDKKECL